MTAACAILFVHLGAALHAVQLPATLLLARGLRQSGFLAEVPSLARAALGVLAGGVVLAALAGAVSVLLMPVSALEQPFARVQILGWAVFWGYRLLAQLRVYAPFVPASYRWLHWLLVGLFATKSGCFAVGFWAAWQ